MKCIELPEFARDLKRLQKKYLSLKKDLERLKPYLQASPKGNNSKHWNCLHKNEAVEIYKVRLACSYLNAGTMRIIYGYRVEEGVIDFIELYYKGEKRGHDEKRLKYYLA